MTGLSKTISSLVLLIAALVSIALPGCARKRADVTTASFTLRLDAHRERPYLILATESARKDYAAAIAVAAKIHPDATTMTFSPSDLQRLKQSLITGHPYYVLIFIKPGELDVNFAWQWLTLASQIDRDPFVDVRTGFITGESPEMALQFMQRTAEALEGKLTLPDEVVDNLGPNTMMKKNDFQKQRGSYFLPVFSPHCRVYTISHGAGGFPQERRDAMNDAGIVHFGGHGYPDRIVDGLDGPGVRQLHLSPCIVFNGACYTGVTGKWFEMFTPSGRVKEYCVEPQRSFCLTMLGNNSIAYLAALHPDHGLPVYQEMEYLAYSGSTLGDTMKHTCDGVVVGSGGALPAFEKLKEGFASPRWSPSEIMLKGTAARILFGDPSLTVIDRFTDEPFTITVEQESEQELKITAVIKNLELRSTFTDTYHADLSADRMQFNDRALILCDLPEGWSRVSPVQVLTVSAQGKELSHRLVGYAVELDEGTCRLHLQVDVPARGYMLSELRTQGASLVLKVRRQPGAAGRSKKN